MLNDVPFGPPLVQMVRLGKRKRLANVARLALSQSAIPALHVRNLSTALANRTMDVFGNHLLISLPKITVGDTATIIVRQSVPQAATGSFASVADDESDDLTSSTTHHSPEPAFVDFLEYKTPGFIAFQNIIRASRQNRCLKSRQVFDMLHNPSRGALAMKIEQTSNPTQTDTLLVGFQDNGFFSFFASRFDSRTRRAPQSWQ